MEKKKSLKQLEAKAEEFDILYRHIESDNELLRAFMANLESQQERIYKAEDYYFGDWIDDRDIVLAKFSNFYDFYSEDLFYDALQERIKMMEKMVEICKEAVEKMVEHRTRPE
ncbi:MAG: hypothetical protein GX145_04270 [Clostridiaceae bacterium]|mgnify:CR=1 FL=1|jgi:hypothetical protein|nr:hypothetical protein [Bacillota bacterium]NLN52007.1 hypothetical protein [Clostridiaceae bacterium]